MRVLFFVFCLGMISFSCQSDQELVIVPDNTAPPDFSVPLVLKENFINKSFVTLLGRKPSAAERSQSLDILNRDNAQVEDRKEVLDNILAMDEFSIRQYDIGRTEMLNNLDTIEIRQLLFTYEFLLTQPEYEQFYDLIRYEIQRAQALRSLPNDLLAGRITRVAMHKIFVSNNFYDEINMGSQNFVLSLFEYFLGRNPSEEEERRAIGMVDNFPTVIFEMEGDSKDDFIDIFLDSNDYFEGEVINIYRDFLFRSPTSYEMASDTQFYHQSLNYKELLKRILSKDEFLGI